MPAARGSTLSPAAGGGSLPGPVEQGRGTPRGLAAAQRRPRMRTALQGPPSLGVPEGEQSPGVI